MPSAYIYKKFVTFYKLIENLQFSIFETTANKEVYLKDSVLR